MNRKYRKTVIAGNWKMNNNVSVVYDGKTTILSAGENEFTIQLKDDKNE